MDAQCNVGILLYMDSFEFLNRVNASTNLHTWASIIGTLIFQGFQLSGQS